MHLVMEFSVITRFLCHLDIGWQPIWFNPADLLIFRHEAQIVISNKNYTDEMADHDSEAYQKLENDMCNTVSTSALYDYATRVH